jgi:carboxymethylenebutenolidase
LVVIQELFGVNAHIRSVADKFAQHGFLSIAPALFDRVERDVELMYEGPDMQKALALVRKLDIEQSVKDVAAALDYAREQTGRPAAVVGFCFGGSLAWLSATRLDPAATVGYYGGHIAAFASEKPRVPVMLHFGRRDAHIPPTDVAKIEEAHPQVAVYWYDAGHAFNCDARASYNDMAARQAFARTLEFLERHLPVELQPVDLQEDPMSGS